MKKRTERTARIRRVNRFFRIVAVFFFTWTWKEEFFEVISSRTEGTWAKIFGGVIVVFFWFVFVLICLFWGDYAFFEKET